MASGSDIREFLTTRRARITPDQAELSAYGGRRRVSGLRREEVAMLAGISVEYYTQLERGSVRGVSEDVLDAISRALQLDDVERVHLFDLVRAAKQRPTRGRRTPERVRPGVQRVLEHSRGTAGRDDEDWSASVLANGCELVRGQTRAPGPVEDGVQVAAPQGRSAVGDVCARADELDLGVTGERFAELLEALAGARRVHPHALAFSCHCGAHLGPLTPERSFSSEPSVW